MIGTNPAVSLPELHRVRRVLQFAAVQVRKASKASLAKAVAGLAGKAVLRSTLFPAARAGSFGLSRDLHCLFVLHAETHVALTVLLQAAKELRDDKLLSACAQLEEEGLVQKGWLENQIKHRAPHTLVVPQ